MDIDQLFSYALHGVAESACHISTSIASRKSPSPRKIAFDENETYINNSYVAKVLDNLFAPLEIEASCINTSRQESEDKNMIEYQETSISSYQDLDPSHSFRGNFDELADEMASIRALLSSEEGIIKTYFTPTVPPGPIVISPSLSFAPSTTPTYGYILPRDVIKHEPNNYVENNAEITLPTLEIQDQSYASPMAVKIEKIETSDEAFIATRLKPPRSSVKKRPMAEVGRMESLAKELLDLVDVPLEDPVRSTSVKRSREMPGVAIEGKFENDLVETKERKRSLMTDLGQAADKDQLANARALTPSLLLLSQTQVVEAKSSNDDKERRSRMNRVTLPSSSLPLPPLPTFSNFNFSRAWAPQSHQSPAKSLPRASTSNSASMRDQKSSQSSIGRYPTGSNSKCSRHLEGILSQLVSPKR